MERELESECSIHIFGVMVESTKLCPGRYQVHASITLLRSITMK